MRDGPARQRQKGGGHLAQPRSDHPRQQAAACARGLVALAHAAAPTLGGASARGGLERRRRRRAHANDLDHVVRRCVVECEASRVS